MIQFMGNHSRRLWWDVRWRGGWLVVKAGFIKRPRLPRVYWSPDGTPGHPEARNVFRCRDRIRWSR